MGTAAVDAQPIDVPRLVVPASPEPLVLGLRWEFYGIGLVGAFGLGWWVRRNYRFTTLEKSGSVTVVRSERRQQD